MLKFNLESLKFYTIVSFSLKNKIIKPDILKSITPPDPIQHNFAHQGVLLSGRGPIWLYGFLVHYYHPTRWVATFDPRLQAAVVVESHDPATQVGDLITLPSKT